MLAKAHITYVSISQIKLNMTNPRKLCKIELEKWNLPLITVMMSLGTTLEYSRMLITQQSGFLSVMDCSRHLICYE